jgi:hypothetical protein
MINYSRLIRVFASNFRPSKEACTHARFYCRKCNAVVNFVKNVQT